MNNNFKLLLRLILPQPIYTLAKEKYQKRLLREWNKNGCPVPPPHIVKQLAVQEYQKKYGYEIFVETGTYLGTMVEAQKKIFERIFSIEIDDILFKKAQKRFENEQNISIIHGDSGKVLPDVLRKINRSAIFWLDGHYSAGVTSRGDIECPIFEELRAILAYNELNHILLIDDARCFTGEGDYPTMTELSEFIKSKDERYQITVVDDIIRCVI